MIFTDLITDKKILINDYFRTDSFATTSILVYVKGAQSRELQPPGTTRVFISFSVGSGHLGWQLRLVNSYS